jgi:hypothetical protein
MIDIYIVDAVVGGSATPLEIQAESASAALDIVMTTYGYSTFIHNIVEKKADGESNNNSSE